MDIPRKLNASAWNDKFEELKQYKSQHGHCNVPYRYEKNQPLGTWVQTQRTQFNHSKLSKERINMLNAICFIWGVSNDKSWNDKFEELKKYKSKYGDCNVPAKYDKNQPLATWVQKQRTQFKQSKMSEERINMLNAIDFDWGVSNDKSWNDKFEELEKYKSQHGDCDVPRKYDKNQPLRNWVGFQRTLFKQSKLSEERINMLNTIGFNWSVQDKIWNDKFEQLKQYKSKHGHCNVPQKYDENQSLAYWVRNQRTQFNHSTLSEERINILNSIGFNWRAVSTHYDSVWNDTFEELHAVGKEIDTDQDDSDIEENHEQIAIKTSYQDSKEKETTTYQDSKEEKEHDVGNAIDTEQDDRDIDENHEQIAIETSYQDSKEKETTSYQDSKEEKEHAVGKEINTEQDDSVIEEIHEQIACTTTKEKGDMPSKRSLQDNIQVLCKISIMFQEQKDAIHADMKRRKLGNSA